jgi:hypothetical protein
MRNYQQWVKFLTNKYPEMIKSDKVIDVGDGWMNLVKLCCERLYNTKITYNETHDDKIEFPIIVQVKQKFGGLRFYFDCNDKIKDELEHAISFAESLSFKICEDCGRSGKTRQEKPWVQTLCDNCVINNNKEIKVKSFKPIEEQLRLKRMNNSGIWKIVSDGIGNKSHAQDELDHIIAAIKVFKIFKPLMNAWGDINKDFNEENTKNAT